MVVYYFSGTGNSLYIAKSIADSFGADLQPIGQLSDSETILIDTDVIGIVFPVYYGELPVMVKKFAQKLVSNKENYVFAVSNFGGAAGQSLNILKSILADREIELSAGYGVHMPQNAFKKSWEKVDKVYAQAEKRIGKIVKKIGKRAKGMFYSNVPLEIVLRLMHPMIEKACRLDFLEKTGVSEELETDELIYLMDKNHSTDENCNGCGTCASVCPSNNITMINDKPEWLHRCENCLACYDWCPQSAVHGTVAKEGHYYRHPEVKVKDMIWRVR